MTDEQIYRCIRDYDANPFIEQLEFGIETNKVCFLISRDQKTLIPEPWYFHYAGQWNAYSPFVKIQEIEIAKIEQLADIVLLLRIKASILIRRVTTICGMIYDVYLPTHVNRLYLR